MRLLAQHAGREFAAPDYAIIDATLHCLHFYLFHTLLSLKKLMFFMPLNTMVWRQHID
jgi:hypothetical protein